MESTHRYISESSQPLRVEGEIQRYAWGKVGSSSRIARFFSSAPPAVPLAEYWLGCHPKAPSNVVLPDGSRCSLMKILPDRSALPFMVKVLSINPELGLSIQSHPDAELAQALHGRDPEHYPDPFHKPEVGIALSPVTLLYDIKSPAGLSQTLEEYPELNRLLSEATQQIVEAHRNGSNGPACDVRRGVFSDCITADPEPVAQVVTDILQRYAGVARESVPEPVVIIERLSKVYGAGDVGLVVLLLMNLVSLQPGEGIFIGPNIPHAYLDGDLVECMASSDNVIRAGLTSKYRDVQTLVDTTDYDFSDLPRRASVKEIAQHLQEFVLPVEEFRLMVVEPGADRVELDLSSGHALALCIGGQAVISCEAMPEGLEVTDGQAVLLPYGLKAVKVSTNDAQLFIAQSKGAAKEGFEYER